MWAVFHSSVTTVSLYLIPPVDVAISGDADVSIQTQAEVFGQVEEVLKGAIVDIHKQSLELQIHKQSLELQIRKHRHILVKVLWQVHYGKYFTRAQSRG